MKKTKEVVPEKKPILGRPGNTLQMGIVGLPNVGKSSTFSLLSKHHVPSENFMFCTIDPNLANVEVPDPRFDKLVALYKPKSKVLAKLKVIDIAGLVKGASQNQGMGNAFLSHISAVDGIFHCVRAFDDEDVQHYEGDTDPIRDMDIINEELMLKDKALVEKNIESVSKALKKHNTNENILEFETLSKIIAYFEKGITVREGDWDNREIEVINGFNFLSAKPVVYLVNISSKDYARKKNKWLVKIKKWVDEHGGGKIIPYSVAYEQGFADCQNEEEVAKYIQDTGIDSSLAKIINAGYEILELIHFFTCGADEVKCWTVRKDTKAPKAAGVIHSDIERGFISAEVMTYDDLMKFGNENGVKKEGKVRNEGKNYEVKDGDIIYFKFNVSDPSKKKK